MNRHTGATSHPLASSLGFLSNETVEPQPQPGLIPAFLASKALQHPIFFTKSSAVNASSSSSLLPTPCQTLKDWIEKATTTVDNHHDTTFMQPVANWEQQPQSHDNIHPNKGLMEQLLLLQGQEQPNRPDNAMLLPHRHRRQYQVYQEAMNTTQEVLFRMTQKQQQEQQQQQNHS
jgi:hypothetical protein